jgi:4-alpha-glucanotransferase
MTEDSMLERGSGILLHPTSFPGPYGIGDLGPSSFRFIDWMEAAGQHFWQLMPLGPTGFGDSPYASPSAFAGNPLLISLDWLRGDGLLNNDDFVGTPSFSDDHVDFGSVIPFKQAMLRKAFGHWQRQDGDKSEAFELFRLQHAQWLADFALFMSIKDEMGGANWITWPVETRLRKPDAISEARTRLAEDELFHTFVQFVFRNQWQQLKQYANDRGVRVIGDIPIFVALDSADAWANRELFELDEQAMPTVVSGVPPDYFSADGQLWGNPVFNWTANRESNFAWWIERARATLDLVDIIRIDHFRAFAASWSVPADAETAAGGFWTRGPGEDVFHAIASALGPIEIVVEDLGLITADVVELRQRLGYPGMKVLQFAFNGDPQNVYLPHMYESQCVVYTGTHDNDTTIGWFTSLDTTDRARVQSYIGRDGRDVAWDLMRIALASVASVALFPLQDVLRLGQEGRMNTPGRAGGNWGWRYQPDQLTEDLARGLRSLTEMYGRGPVAEAERGTDPFDYTVDGTAHPLY